MGILDIFSKESRQSGQLARAAKRTKNKTSKSEDRFPALRKLKEIGTEESLLALAHRFDFNYDKSIEDEQEKDWVYSSFLELGQKSIAPIRRYVLSKTTISWPLKILERVCDDDALLAIVDEVLAKEPPDYTRDPGKKIQLISWLGEIEKGDVAEINARIIPYLQDFDETVRFTAVEALDHKQHESAKEALLEALLRPEEESKRLRVRIADLVAKADWRISDFKQRIQPLLETDLEFFKLDHEKLLRTRDK